MCILKELVFSRVKAYNLVQIVQSNIERGVTYNIDMDIGTCTCPAGRDWSPCSHQAVVVLHYRCTSINCVTTTPQGNGIGVNSLWRECCK